MVNEHAKGLTSEDLGEDEHSFNSVQQQVSAAISAKEEGQRLDRFLASLLPDISRSQLQQWVTDAQVLINGEPTKPSHRLRAGQMVSVAVPAAEPANDWRPEPMALDILYEDDSVMVVNKPAGLVVHPAAGHAHGTLVNGLLAHCKALAILPRGGIVHRLDRDTTGLMVVAKTGPAQLSLVAQLANRTVSRRYLALVWGQVSAQTVTTQIGRDPRDRQRMAVLPEPKGKPAITEVKPLVSGKLFGHEVTLVRCTLQTGRTHQIRVHLEHLGHPIVGDRTYLRKSPPPSKLGQGKKQLEDLLPGQALHAFSLKFKHPDSAETVAYIAAIPESLLEVLALSEIQKVHLKTIA